MAYTLPSRYVPAYRGASLAGNGVPNTPRPERWQLPNLAQLGRDLSKYGSGGRAGYASVSYPVQRTIENPNLTPPIPVPVSVRTDAEINAGWATQMAGVQARRGEAGAGGPVGPIGPPMPTVGDPQPVDSPYLTEQGVDSLLPPEPVNLGAPDINSGAPAPRIGTYAPQSRSSSEQTMRYYDRKFGQDSRDPVVRMQSRRIDGRTPTVGYRPAPVQFQNSPTDWSPY